MLFLFDCINTIVFVLLARIFLEVFLSARQTNQMRTSIVMVVWMIIEIAISTAFDSIFIVKAFVTICCTILASSILFTDSIVKKMILSIIHYGFIASVEVLVYLLSIQMASYIQITDVRNSLVNVYGGVISDILILSILVMLRYLFVRENTSSISGKDMAKFLVFPLISICMLFAFSYCSHGREVSENEIQFFIIVAIIFLALNLYMYWLLKTDLMNKIMKERILASEIHAKELSDLYEQIREEHKTIASIEHEYKNHMTVISSLAISKKYDELNLYLQGVKGEIGILDVVNTGNAVCSALFNAKYAESNRKGIQVRFDISNLTNMKIKDEEMVIILSNLFNNAIEACEKCESNKVIELKIDYSNDVLFVLFSNTYDKKTTENYPKNHDLIHGHGLSNVRRIVESYDGQIDVERDERFTVRLIIPLV